MISSVVFLQTLFILIELYINIIQWQRSLLYAGFYIQTYMDCETMPKHTSKSTHMYASLLPQNKNANEFISLRVAPNGDLCTYI